MIKIEKAGDIVIKEGKKQFLHRYHKYEYLDWNDKKFGADFIPLGAGFYALYSYYVRCKRCGMEKLITRTGLI